MRAFISTCSVLALLGLGGCSDSSLSPQEQAFAERYREAHASGEVDKVLALHWLEGVPEQDRSLLGYAIMQEMSYPIAAIRFGPLEADDTIDFVHEGQKWGPNLPLSRRAIIVFDTPERLHASFLLGEYEGRYYFVNAAPVEKGTPNVPDL